MRVVVSIAGSDSSAGAGIQADIKAIAANGGYAASVLTAITAQNTLGVQLAHALPVDVVRAQIASVFDDLDVVGVKTGMLGDVTMIAAIADELVARRPEFVVVDPVMISKTGFALLERAAISTLLERLMPLATLVTPNVHEAEALTGLRVRTVAEAEAAGRRLLEAGVGAALVKGGHLEGSARDRCVGDARRGRCDRGRMGGVAAHAWDGLHVCVGDCGASGVGRGAAGRRAVGEGVRDRGESRWARDWSRGRADRSSLDAA